MANKVYFRKELVKNKLMFKDGTYAPFEILGEGYGVLTLDADTDKEKIDQLRGFIAKKTGGVSEVSLEAFEETKKKFDLSASQTSRFAQAQAGKAPRLFNPNLAIPVGLGSAVPAPALESAKSAAVTETVPPATAPAESPPELPRPMGRKVRLNVGKPKPADGP